MPHWQLGQWAGQLIWDLDVPLLAVCLWSMSEHRQWLVFNQRLAYTDYVICFCILITMLKVVSSAAFGAENISILRQFMGVEARFWKMQFQFRPSEIPNRITCGWMEHALRSRRR